MTLPPLTRIKIALQDTGSPSLLFTATGGLVDYADLYAHHGGADAGEAAILATIRSAAGTLSLYYATQPISISSGGESVAWAAERAAFYRALALGGGGGLAAPSSAGGASTLTPVW